VSVEAAPDPVAGPGEAVVRISVAALNHRDVWIRKGQYAGLRFPIVLGSDGVGELVQASDGSDLIGKQVIIDPSLQWGASQAAQGANFRILGLPDDGTFAELVKVPLENVHPKPEHLSDQEAAALPLAGLTAYRAVYARGGLHTRSEESVLVTGAGGGAATFAVQFAAASGAAVWVTTGAVGKLDHAKRLGASGGVLYSHPDWDTQLREAVPGGFDLIIDSAGGEGFGKLIDLAAPGGRVVFFGATNGNPAELNMRKVFWKQLSLLGTTMGSPADFRSMIELVRSKGVRPVVDSAFSLDNANEALDHMEQAGQSGKIVLEVN
jgi:NADPH:quinone reductase-like Zn-dependent oxidoreductase